VANLPAQKSNRGLCRWHNNAALHGEGEVMDDLDLLKATPGSDLALDHGCTCPVLDNCHGRGYMGQDDVFVMSHTCPLHGDLDSGS
jgi:hypothetical protein